MNLQAGYRLTVAAAFHLPVDWAERVSVGTGTEPVGAGFAPRTDWRPAGQGELELLVSDGPAGEDPRQSCLSLFCLPRHLLNAWDRMLEHAAEAGSPAVEGLDEFAFEAAEFLAFKGLPVPAGAAFDLLVCKPGQRSASWNLGTPGMSFTFDPQTPLSTTWTDAPRLWGVLNMGTEPARVVFLNLPGRSLLAEVGRSGAVPGTGTVGELTGRFFTSCPDYPVVCLQMEPGEGLRFPDGGLLVDGCTLGREEPDVLLMIRSPRPLPAAGASAGRANRGSPPRSPRSIAPRGL